MKTLQRLLITLAIVTALAAPAFAQFASYNPFNQYWTVTDTNPGTHVFSSASQSYVVLADATYVAWLAGGGVTLTIATNNALQQYISALNVVGGTGNWGGKSAAYAATTANITLSGEQTIDGVVLTSGMRVLVKNQSASAENGIYVVSTGAWARAVDANTSAKIAGSSIYIVTGTVNGGSFWFCSFGNLATLGTSSMIWAPAPRPDPFTTTTNLTTAGTAYLTWFDTFGNTWNKITAANLATALGAGGLTVGTTTITSGTDTRILYDNAGVVGEDSGFTTNGAGALAYTASIIGTTTSATALSVGRQGSTTPVLNVNANTASQVTGINITGAAAAGRVAIAVTSSDANEGLSLDAKGSGTIRLGATSTGAVEFSRNAVPTASDGAALGTTSLKWSDLFLASGGAINWNSSDVSITHGSTSGGFLDFTGAAGGYSFNDGPFITGFNGPGQTYGGVIPHQLNGTSLATASWWFAMYNTSAATSAERNFYRSKGATIVSTTVVADGDNLGSIKWYGAQQTGTSSNMNTAAAITAEVDGTVTSGAGADMPGRLKFQTSPDASGTLATRMTINNAGVVSVDGTTDSTTSATGILTVAGGVGIAKHLHVGTTLSAGLTTATPGVSGVITIMTSNAALQTALVLDNANVSGGGSQILWTQSGSPATIGTIANYYNGSNWNMLLGTSGVSGQLTLLDTGQVKVTTTTASTSSTTGAFISSGGIGAAGAIWAGTYVATGVVAVGSLPACGAGIKGARMFVTDANATTFASTVAAGGANNVPVVCDGTNWIIGRADVLDLPKFAANDNAAAFMKSAA